LSDEKEKEEQKVEYIELAKINVPDLRVTSVVDEGLMSEMLESIKARGILEPLAIADVDGEYVLIDGLHRILAARRLGMKEVPCLVKKMTMDNVLMENLIRTRQRGHSDPAQEAEVLRQLVDEFNYSLRQAAQLMGFSATKADKLYKIAALPTQIKQMIRAKQIPSEGAYYITFLQDNEKQLEVAEDAMRFGYTVEQIKARVQQLMRPECEPEPGSWSFTPAGEPIRQPFICHICGQPIEGEAQYIWLDYECLNAVNQLRDIVQSQPIEQVQENKQAAEPQF